MKGTFTIIVLMTLLIGVIKGQRNLAFPDQTNTRPQNPANRPAGVPTKPSATIRPPKIGDPADELTLSSLGVVFQVRCPCPSTPEYNPVCGTDGRTYVNRQMLGCAKTCGVDVEMSRLGVCSTPRK